MTVEDAIQTALDTNPADHLARMVLADYLDEINDPRGPGYREMGRLGIYPRYAPETYPGDIRITGSVPGAWEWWNPITLATIRTEHKIPNQTWFDAIKTAEPHHVYRRGSRLGIPSIDSRDFLSRRAADDAAAIAYSIAVKTVGAT